MWKKLGMTVFLSAMIGICGCQKTDYEQADPGFQSVPESISCIVGICAYDWLCEGIVFSLHRK